MCVCVCGCEEKEEEKKEEDLAVDGLPMYVRFLQS